MYCPSFPPKAPKRTVFIASGKVPLGEGNGGRGHEEICDDIRPATGVKIIADHLDEQWYYVTYLICCTHVTQGLGHVCIPNVLHSCSIGLKLQ
jgi:hypothetical protein